MALSRVLYVRTLIISRWTLFFCSLFVVLGSSHAIGVVGSCRRDFGVGVHGVPRQTPVL